MRIEFRATEFLSFPRGEFHALLFELVDAPRRQIPQPSVILGGFLQIYHLYVIYLREQTPECFISSLLKGYGIASTANASCN